MRFPFTYMDECYKSEQKVTDKRKRAITRAERNALRRAFDVACDVWEDDRVEGPVILSDTRPELPRRSTPSAGDTPPEGGSPSAAAPPPRGPAPEGPSGGPVLDPGRSVVVRCREMGLDDDQRHRMVAWVTEGRTESTKDLTAREASRCHTALHTLSSTGEAPWPPAPTVSRTTTSDSSSPPSTPSPAPTTTSPKETDPGDDVSVAAPSSG